MKDGKKSILHMRKLYTSLTYGSKLLLIVLCGFCLMIGCKNSNQSSIIQKGSRIVFLGNSFSEGFQRSNYFETLLYQNYPDSELIVRNLGWSGDEVDLRLRPLNFPSLDSSLMQLKADILFVSFGLNEAYRGKTKVELFEKNLEKFLLDIKDRKYKGTSYPQVILISPIAYESINEFLPEESEVNSDLEIYSQCMKDVANRLNIRYIDLFHPMRDAMAKSVQPLTTNGIHLNESGYKRASEIMAEDLGLSIKKWQNTENFDRLKSIINEKNKHYFYTYRPANSEYFIGRRKDWPGGKTLQKEKNEIENMVSRLDSVIWKICTEPDASGYTEMKRIIQNNSPKQELYDVDEESKYKPDKSQFILKEGYEIDLFASEQDFPIGNPVSMTFDARGRLWVATMPSYPNYVPGVPPNDKIVILEDHNRDGKADSHTVFADSLYMPLGFELYKNGIFVTQAPDFLYLEDTTGDDIADIKNFVLHGFGTEDAHHSLSNYSWGPDGALYMHMGTFLHSQVETPYGLQRGAYGTTWKFNPKTLKLDNYISYPYANPWGNVFNKYGDHLIADASTGRCHFGTPLSTDIDFPKKHTSQKGFLTAQFAPKTCGMEVISSSNFPQNSQGDILLNTFVGFQGIRQHKLLKDSSEYIGKEVDPFLQSTDVNFRPVDIKFGPDGALYVLDWFNPIIQHGEQGFRENERDHFHGRIWRIKYVSNPLNSLEDFSKMSIAELLNNLKSTTDREKYRIRSQLVNFSDDEVEDGLEVWLDSLEENEKNFELCQLEALWMYQRMHRFNENLLKDLLDSKDEQIRAAAVKVMFYWKAKFKGYGEKLLMLTNDPSFKVRLETAVALSHEKNEVGIMGLLKILEMPTDEHIRYVLKEALMNLQPVWISMFDKDPNFLINDLKSAGFLFNLLEDSELLALPGFLKDDPNWEKFTWQKPTDEIYNRLSNSEAYKKYKTELRVQSIKDSEGSNESESIAHLTLRVIPGKMLYDKDILTVKVGQRVVLKFENEDNMAHNVVVVEPGYKEEIGEMADKMASESDGYERSFIPDSENILFYTPLINSGEEYTLEFTAPIKKGKYPFICTFPGHWRIMQGVLMVN